MSIGCRECVEAALAGRPTPRPAVGPLAVHYCARWAGVSLRRYTLDPAALADSVARYHERFRPDAVWLSADTWVTAEAMGAEVGFTGDEQPAGGTGRPRVRTAGDIAAIPPPDPMRHGRWPLMLDALRRLRAALGGDVFLVACFDQYPFSLACELMGIDHVMFALVEDRPRLEALAERCLEYAEAYALALAAEGADMLSGGDSPAGLIGPRWYAEVAQPLERRLIERLHAATGLPVSLHICGDATPILDAMAATGADVLEVDAPIDIAEAFARAGPRTALWGNLDPVRVLAQADPATVRRETAKLLARVRACGGRRFVLSSGCTLAVETPAENLDAFFAAARDFGSLFS